ncbi:MAG: PqiC family protein [Janthinobacterium lividum]
MRHALVLTIAVSGATLLAGCGHSPAATFLTIDAAPPAAAPLADYGGAPLRVPFVHVPVALDRPEYVRQMTAGTIAVDDFARWSAPLGRLARDTLVRDLTQRLAGGSVLAPDAAPAHSETVVQATVLDVTMIGTTATMTVSYGIGPSPRPTVIQLTTPLAGAAPVDSARAWSALIGQLADRIVADLPAR